MNNLVNFQIELEKMFADLQGRIQDFEKVGAGEKRPNIFFRTQVQNCFAPTPFSHSSLIGPYWECRWDEEM